MKFLIISDGNKYHVEISDECKVSARFVDTKFQSARDFTVNLKSSQAKKVTSGSISLH